MKNTKKLLTLALVGAMLTATGITAFAVDTEVTQNTTPPTGATTVNYQVNPVYTVVIPESVTLKDTEDATATIKIYGATENDNVVLGKGQKVNVALTASKNDFNVANADGGKVTYTVNDKSAVADLKTVAECTADDGKKDTTLTFAKTGTAAYAGTYTDTLTFGISVEDAAVAVTGVTLNKTSLELTAGGDTATLTATVVPDTATDKTVTWTTSDASIATVADGVVTPVAAGTATITANAGGKTAECTITVKAATRTVTMTASDLDWSGTAEKDSVTVKAKLMDPQDGNLIGGGTFTTSSGKFTKIVVTAEDCSRASGTGWSGNSKTKTWTGNASSVSFSGDFLGLDSGITITFTIEG